MRVSDSQHFRKMVAGFCMLAGPAAILFSFAVSPRLETAAGRQLAAAAGHPDRYLMSQLGALLAMVFMVGAVLGLAHIMRERAGGYGAVGGLFSILGILGITAVTGVAFMVWLMVKDGVTGSDVNLLHRFIHSGAVVPMTVASYCFAVGLVVLCMGLYRSHAVDWWMAMLIAVGAVAAEVSFPAHALWLGIVGSAFMFVGLGSIGLMVLRETDADWEHTPDYRGFRPVAGMS